MNMHTFLELNDHLQTDDFTEGTFPVDENQFTKHTVVTIRSTLDHCRFDDIFSDHQ